jgi:glycine amidinotransferase/scyllo-inosamine-4-phosphate amidinotransferase 1
MVVSITTEEQRTTAVGAARPAVNSWDEFTRLREVIVGDATHARLPAMTDISAWMACYPQLTSAELDRVAVGAFPTQVIEETREDLAALIATLRDLDVMVRQPASPDHSKVFSSPDWTSDGYLSYCPRDITMVFGPTIVETPSPMRARYFEHLGYRELFQEYMNRGAAWISAPKPRLADDLFSLDADGLPLLGESEPVFDAANVLRVGRDLIYLVSRSGNEAGLRWLESTLRMMGDFRVHPMRGVYGYTHIDTTVTLLRPGLVLLNPARLTPDTVPEPFKNWDILWSPQVRDVPTVVAEPLSAPWLGMNLLMVSPEIAIVDAEQPELIAALEKHRITVLPHTLRHSRVLGGGFHCVTLDVVRDGGLEDYCS